MEATPEGFAAAAATRDTLKRKHAPENGAVRDSKKPAVAPPVPNIPPPVLSHEYSVPPGYVPEKELDPKIHGTMEEPFFKGKPAKEYPFKLDKFQEVAVACLERNESVLVAAHTSAGKTAVAEYAIAMAMRDNQKVVYTSPLKALSNQKFRELQEEFSDVGLLTGDVSVNQNAPITVMTTEILRSILYRGSELEREVAWVIFDEVHYMQDRERGVVWEETIIFLPKQTRMVFLSATLSNAGQFASWIAHLRQQPCHVVYTDYRPTPLQHYAFPEGGAGLFLVKDEAGKFRSENFEAMRAAVKEAAELEVKELPRDSDTGGRGGFGRRGRGGRGRGRLFDQKKPQASAKRAIGFIAVDVAKILKMIKQRHLEPVIVFSNARRDCEHLATHMHAAKLDFNDESEKEQVQEVFDSAISVLSEEDKDLEAVTHLLPLIRAGIGVHHSGLLPILKELVELLFQEQLVKVLFATETFAMGLNMPARTVVFTGMRKWDGTQMRYMTSGEYIQMSGRAGRRGKDDKGLCIMMMDAEVTNDACREIVMGKPSPLLSSFKLTYYTLINLMRRMEGTGHDMEHVIKCSFQQFQFESSLPELKKELEDIEKEASGIKVTSQGSMLEFVKLRKEIRDLEDEVLKEVLRPERCLQYLRGGRILRIVDGVKDWGWSVLVGYSRQTRPPPVRPVTGGQGALLPAREGADLTNDVYILHCLLACSPSSVEAGVPMPAKEGEEGEMHVVPVPLSLVRAISTLRINLPPDLKNADHRKSTQLTLQELQKRFRDGLPRMDPIDDMEIRDMRVISRVNAIEKLERQLAKNEVYKEEKASGAKLGLVERKAVLEARAEALRASMRDSQLANYRMEVHNRTNVLRKLGHISSDGIVLAKGRAACELDTADELMAVELLFNGVFQKLDVPQTVALASVLVPLGDTSQEEIRMKAVLAEPLAQLQETARYIAAISNECKLSVNEDEYVDSFKPVLMDVVYSWSKGHNFKAVTDMTDVFEGSIIRYMRRLDEFLSQLMLASNVVGESALAKKFEECITSIRRDVVFSASLYL